MASSRVALCTPGLSGVSPSAEYARQLIPGLGSLLNFKVIENAPGRSGLRDFDTVLYFLCDDLSCGWIYRAALEHPGVLVLNDARPDFRSIVRSVATDHSDVVLVEAYYELFGEDWRWRSGKTLEAIALPGQPFSMTRRILDRSRACIVHNTLAEEQVRGKGFRRPLARIPWGTRLSALDGAATREQFGFHQSNAVIGIFGFTADEIEVCGILEVFSRLCEVAQHVRLLIVCRPSDQSRLAERITYGHLTSRVRVVPQTGAFDALIATCDVVWNIRSDPSDESVQLAVQAMGQGKVVLLSDSAQNRDFPSDGCVRIPADSSRRRVTLKVLHWLTSNLEAIAEIGQTGATWASQDQKWDDVARKFADFINNCETGETLKRNTLRDDETCDYLLRWVQPDDSAAYFKLHASRLIRTLALTPWAQSGDRVLEMGCYLQMTAGLQHLLGYEVRGCYLGSRGRDRKIIRSSEGEIFECLIDLFNCEKDHFPYPDQHFATVLCCELIEHLKEDPMHMMREINRILKPGGSLVLTTPNATSLRAVNAILSGDHPAYYNSYPDPARRRFEAPRHEREYTPKELVRLFAHSGFSVETVVTGPYDETSGDRFPAVSRILNALGEASSLRDECVFIVGRKSGSPAPHLPEWLYDAL